MQELAQHIAAQLKALRVSKAWSLDQTAQHTGISKAMLGQIERGESNPTVVTLWKIAHGMHSHLSYFLPSEAQTTVQRTFAHQQEALSVSVLQPFNAELGYEILHVRLQAFAAHQSCAHAAHVIEDILPINGAVLLQLEQSEIAISLGETARFSAHQAHGYLNPNAFEVQFYNIVHYGKT